MTNTLAQPARRWAAQNAAHAPPVPLAPLATVTDEFTCPGCQISFQREITAFLLPPLTAGRRYLYCSDDCLYKSHPWREKKTATKPRVAALSPADAAAEASHQRALRWEQSACADGNGYPSRYRRFNLSALPLTAKAAAPNVLDWVPTIHGKGLGLMGHSEAGKSYLAAELARRLWMTGHDVTMCSMPGLIVALKGGVGMEARTALVERVKAAEIVLFDDVGMEGHTENSLSSLYDILQHREEWERPNLYTCNLGGAGLRDKFVGAVPLYNRLKRTAEWRTV